jgi:hypothetical protein
MRKRLLNLRTDNVIDAEKRRRAFLAEALGRREATI